MVLRAKRLADIKGGDAVFLAIGLLSAAGVLAIALSMEMGIGAAAFTLLHVAAMAGAFLAWLRADAASKAAEKASSDLALFTQRLIRLEQQVRAPGAVNPALRSTMAEVTGTVGLLGGVVRELARNVAAQNRDVAYLKDTLGGGAKVDSHERPEIKGAPEPRPSDEPDLPQPEPSLLPRKETEEEIRRMRLVTQAFEADRIELHLQPVVALPQRKVRFYEVLARLRLTDGTLLGPMEFLPLLERLGRAPELDRRVVTRAIAVARHLLARGSEAIVGVNLSLRSVREPGFLFSLARMIEAAPEILGKVVLELPHEALRSLDAEQRDALGSLRDRGVPLSVDRASDLTFDARALADMGVRFLKLPTDLMIAAAAKEDSQAAGVEVAVRDFASILRREGIKLVAERVEREDMVPALIDLGAPLAQGFVFAVPRAIRAEVLDPAGQRGAVPSGRSPTALRRHAG